MDRSSRWLCANGTFLQKKARCAGEGSIGGVGARCDGLRRRFPDSLAHKRAENIRPPPLLPPNFFCKFLVRAKKIAFLLDRTSYIFSHLFFVQSRSKKRGAIKITRRAPQFSLFALSDNARKKIKNSRTWTYNQSKNPDWTATQALPSLQRPQRSHR
jgi:hypothetical protein